MPIIKTIPYDVIWHYSLLYYGLKWASIHDTSEDVEIVGDEEVCIPKDLSDEDKFICIAFDYETRDLGMTCDVFHELFGWNKYHCSKIRKRVSQVSTVKLICEEGGYGGTGWQINPDIIREIKKFGEKWNKKCYLCSDVHKEEDYNIFICPIEKLPLNKYRILNGYCLYKKIDTSDLYNEKWTKSY